MRVGKECDNLTVLHHGTVVGIATLEEDGELVDPESLDVVAGGCIMVAFGSIRAAENE